MKPITLITMLLFIFVGESLAQNKIPSCPTGSQGTQWNDAEGRRWYQCKLPGKDEQGLDRCLEWEGTAWNFTVSVPCGSRVSHVMEPNGLHCPASEQVYLWDNMTKSLAQKQTCLPQGWEVIPYGESGCLSGYAPAGLGGNDVCAGPKRETAHAPTPVTSTLGRSVDNLVVGGIQTGTTFEFVSKSLVENGYHEIHTPDSDPNYQRLVGRCTLGRTTRNPLTGEAGPPNLSCTSFRNDSGSGNGGYSLLFVKGPSGYFQLVQFTFFFPQTARSEAHYQQAKSKLQGEWGTPAKAGADWARWEVGTPYTYEGVPTHSLHFLLETKGKGLELMVQDIRLGSTLIN